MRTATLDIPANRELVLDQITRQLGIEKGVWNLVGLKESTYYAYKDKHPDFAELIENIRREHKPVIMPYEDNDLRRIATETLRQYIAGGCKTKRLRRIMDAIPRVNEKGEFIRDANGKKTYDYEVRQVIEDLYDNGINMKAYEKVVPNRMTEDSLRFCLSSMFQDISEQPLDDDKKVFLLEYLRGFKERAFLELAASK